MSSAFVLFAGSSLRFCLDGPYIAIVLFEFSNQKPASFSIIFVYFKNNQFKSICIFRMATIFLLNPGTVS